VTWPTHLRTIAVAACAFTLCCGLVTQILARALSYASELGPGLVDLGDFRLYGPFSFLGWTLIWAPIAPTLFVLALCVALVCALAAYAVAIVFAKLEPIALAEPPPWRDLASWREIGHYGLLRDEGLALGAVRHHPWANHRTVRCEASACALIGKPEHTDDAVLAALASWRGTLVLVDARGHLAEKLGREDVFRFAPGRSDALSINPLLAIRGGLHAWDDARRLAAALLTNTYATAQTRIDALALLMLDQLFCAPVEARTLACLRRRLIDRAALVGELCRRWTPEPRPDAAPAMWEMVRVARTQRSEPESALADIAHIDQALAAFADARLAHATDAHQLNLAQFMAAAAPQTLVLSMESVGSPAASLILALLAQLAAHHDGATRAQPLMVAIEADAARLLAELGARLPLGPNTLLQTVDIDHAKRLRGAGQFADPIVAIGPQTEASAESLCQRAGRCVVFAPLPNAVRRWRGIFPIWIKQEVDRLPAKALTAALPSEAFLIAPDQKPVRMRVLVGGAAARFVTASAPAPHDWTASPSDVPQRPQTPETTTSIATPGPTATKIRRVLTRAAAKPASKGAPTK